MASLKITLDRRRALEDDKYPIVFRITSLGQARDISTGFYARESKWNDQSRSVRKNHPSYALLQTHFKELQATYLEKIVEISKEKGNALKAQKIKDYITSEAKETIEPETVQSFWCKEIEYLISAGRVGGARVYKDSLSVISKVKNLKVSFNQITLEVLKNIERTLVGRGMKPNSIAYTSGHLEQFTTRQSQRRRQATLTIRSEAISYEKRLQHHVPLLSKK